MVVEDIAELRIWLRLGALAAKADRLSLVPRIHMVEARADS